MNRVITKIQSEALVNLKIEDINEMQERAIEHCRAANSMILLSPTGTGKTLAYLLPLLERIESCNKKNVRAVIIVPTRELAKQVNEVWRGMRLQYQMVALHGGRPVEQEAAMFAGASPVVVVGTPGRLIDHIKKGTFAVDDCSLVVIDEFDKCLEMGFCEEMDNLLSLLSAVEARYLLSATDAKEIPLFAGTNYGEPLDFRKHGMQPLARTSFYSVTTTPDERLQSLFRLLCSFNGEPAIVFCNFRESVDEVRAFLVKNGLRCAAYHGAMEQKDRELALYRFAASCANILVSTDIAARGLDIKDVKHVVHYQRAMSADIFTHRNGRTARWEAEGAVYLITFEGKELPDYVPDVLQEYVLPRKAVLPQPAQWAAIYVGKGKRDKISRGDLAGFFMKKGGLRADEVGTIMVFDRYSYVAVKMNRMRDVLKTVQGEKIKGIKTIFEPVRG
ncbi:MAG: DEAD/DEAH box helicase [Bacteroidaceae bacterium]|nr:DEAD/DEAH box helicase [Bacteroidaceae bacterium]